MSKITANKDSASVNRRIGSPSGKARQCKAFSVFRPAIPAKSRGITLHASTLSLATGGLMNLLKWRTLAILISIFLLAPLASFADTNCEEGAGALNPAPPQGITPPEIIQK